MSKIEALYTLEVKDKDGKTVSKVTKPCESFVLQFLQLIEAQLIPSDTVENVKDVGAVLRDAVDYASNLKIEGDVSEDNLGIVLGTGTTPVTNIDHVMETLISHGITAGKLSYGSTSKITSGVVGANVDLQLIRGFTNSSGDTINVTEIGIISGFFDGSSSQTCLILHEVVTLTPILNGQTITATITFRTTV